MRHTPREIRQSVRLDFGLGLRPIVAIIAVALLGACDSKKHVPATLNAPVASSDTRAVGLVFEKANPYLEELNAQRKIWDARRPKDYVFVLDMASRMIMQQDGYLRIVVRDGKVESARSLLYLGEGSPESRKTIDQVFDDADYIATFGENRVPVQFEATYDPAFGHPIAMSGDARLEVADDESSFEIACFSKDLKGCQPHFLTQGQCRLLHGQIVDRHGNCDASLGLISAERICCQTDNQVAPQLTPAQCRALGGHEDECEASETCLAASAQGTTCCCRPWVLDL